VLIFFIYSDVISSGECIQLEFGIAYPVSFSITAACLLCFTVYCNWNIGGEDRTIAFLKREGGEDSGEPLLHHVSEKGVIHHHFPINYILKPWRLGVRFYQIIKFGIFQYV